VPGPPWQDVHVVVSPVDQFAKLAYVIVPPIGFALLWHQTLSQRPSVQVRFAFFVSDRGVAVDHGVYVGVMPVRPNAEFILMYLMPVPPSYCISVHAEAEELKKTCADWYVDTSPPECSVLPEELFVVWHISHAKPYVLVCLLCLPVKSCVPFVPAPWSL